MKTVFRVSKQGLTRCPQCARHIFLEKNWRETHCHFCSAHLLAPGVTGPSKAKPVLGRSRANLIAAGLLSASIGIAACDDSGEPDPPADAMVMDAMVMGGMMEMDAAPDMSLPVALYGEPPMFDMDPPVPAPDAGPAPLDAMPQPEPDAAVDAEIDAAPEPEPQPEYGAPPEPDAGAEPDAEMDAARDPGPQPLYGAVPAPEPSK